MSKVVLNTFYLNPNRGDKERIANLVSYIATRDGVINPNNYNHESTKKQEKLINEITGILPHVEDSKLFRHYCLFPTKENASRLITVGLSELNENGEMIKDASKLLSYIAERPGVLKSEVEEVDHGLFTLDGDCQNIADEQAKMIESGSNVYHHAISIKLDEAKYIGMGNKEAWEGLVRRNIVQFAKGSNIKLDDLGFVAAVHESKVSFHVHLMQYSKSNDRSMYFSENALNTIRKNLTKDVYRNHIHEYGNIRDEFFKTQIINKHLSKLDGELVEDLRAALELHKGRKFYGYLTQEDKLKVGKALASVFRSNDDLKIKLDKYLSSQVKYKGLFEKEEGKELVFRREIYNELLNPTKNQKSTFHNQLIDLILNDVDNPSIEIENELEHLEEQQSDYEAYTQSTGTVGNLNQQKHSELRKCEYEVFEASVKNEKLNDGKTISQNRFLSALFSNQLLDMETNELNEQVHLFSKAEMLKNITDPKRESDRITWGSDSFTTLQRQGYFNKLETKEEFDSLVKKINQTTKLKESCLKKEKQILYTRYINRQLKSVSSNRNLIQSQFREYHENDYVQNTAIMKQVKRYINSKKYGNYKSCKAQLNNPYFLNNLTVEDKSKRLLKVELLLNRYEKTTSEKVKAEINLRLKTICESSHDYEKNVYRVSDQSLLHLLSAVLNHKEDEAKYNSRIKKKKFRFKKQKPINR